MKFQYEDLEVWQLAKELITLTYKETANFPKEELFNLTSQIKRSATSCCLNMQRAADGRQRRILLGSLGLLLVRFWR